MLIVTGGAGFIGSNVVEGLNKLGRNDVVVVDDLKNGHKFTNLERNTILDYIDRDDFLAKLANDREFADSIEAVFHQGACSATTEWDGNYMLKYNYEYSKSLLDFCMQKNIPFIYASSAATYGLERNPKEDSNVEAPLNIYGYSKLLFDQHVRRIMDKAPNQIVGLRYFNVFGFGESHKGRMASMVFHWNNQIKENGTLKLFAGSGGFDAGEQRRDFIYVGDVVDVINWFWQHPDKSGIFNVGTGQSSSFNQLADAIVAWHKEHGLEGHKEYIPFPKDLEGSYQHFTQADITKLRAAGYAKEFTSIPQGVNQYLDRLNKVK